MTSPSLSELTSKHGETHGCIVSTVATDALVLKHQAISIHNADLTFIVLDQFHIKILHKWCTRLENKITFWKNEPVVWGLISVLHVLSSESCTHLLSRSVRCFIFMLMCDNSCRWCISIDCIYQNEYLNFLFPAKRLLLKNIAFKYIFIINSWGILLWWSLLVLLSWCPILSQAIVCSFFPSVWLVVLIKYHSDSFGDWAHVDEIHGCLIFRWVAETWLHDRVPA